MTVVAAIFTILFIGIGLLNLVTSVHAPRYQPIAALAYVPVSIAVTWIAAFALKRRSLPAASKYTAFAAVVLPLAFAGFSMRMWLFRLEQALEERRNAAVVVEPLKEELLLSRSGTEIGLRLTFRVRVASDGYYWFRKPDMGLSDETYRALRTSFNGTWPSHGLGLRTIRTDIAPPLESPGHYEAGIDYVLTYELVPTWLLAPRGSDGPCIWLPERFPKEQWEMLLNSTVRGPLPYNPLIGDYEPRLWTKNEYTTKQFFDGIASQGFPFCIEGTSLTSGGSLPEGF